MKVLLYIDNTLFAASFGKLFFDWLKRVLGSHDLVRCHKDKKKSPTHRHTIVRRKRLGGIA